MNLINILVTRIIIFHLIVMSMVRIEIFYNFRLQLHVKVHFTDILNDNVMSYKLLRKNKIEVEKKI
jgi:hypothetical protein